MVPQFSQINVSYVLCINDSHNAKFVELHTIDSALCQIKHIEACILFHTALLSSLKQHFWVDMQPTKTSLESTQNAVVLKMKKFLFILLMNCTCSHIHILKLTNRLNINDKDLCCTIPNNRNGHQQFD